jgi:hypothetical protein
MKFRVVQSDHPLPALGRDDDQEDLGRCWPSTVIVFAGNWQTDSFGVSSIDLKGLLCRPDQSLPEQQLPFFVATVIDRRGDTPPPSRTPIIVWYPLPGPRVRVRSIDADGQPIPYVEFTWNCVVEIPTKG